MELTILERLMLGSILPPQGNVVTLKLVQDLKIVVAFTEEEIADCEIEHDDEEGRVTWNPEATEYSKEIPIGPKAMSLIVGELERRNEEKTLTADFISLYDKFMGE